MLDRSKTEPALRDAGMQPSPELDAPETATHAPESVRIAPSADAAPARFDVIALVTSAGGLEAISAILRQLPEDFPAAVIVAQHLGGQGSALVTILRQRSKLPVTWASSGARLMPGHVLVCPARRQLEVLPDGTCAISAEITVRERPLDGLLESMADSYGTRALGVVLTGMGKDAAAGAAALKRAGGVVLVQSEDTAEQPSMPRAAIACGAPDLVLPLYEIGEVIAKVVTGGELPRPRAEVEAAEMLFSGTGEVRRLLRAIDWPRTSLGPIAGWPVSLRTTLRLVLDSPMPLLVLWGPDHISLYNEAFRLLGVDDALILGQANRAFSPKLWHLSDTIYARLLSGQSVSLPDELYPIARRGKPEDAWFDLSFAPVRGDGGEVAGVLATIVETTERVLSLRRLRTLQALTVATAGVTNVQDAIHRSLATIGSGGGRAGGNPSDQDLPFALGYLRETGSERARLIASSGVAAGGPMAPRTVEMRGAGNPAWPLGAVLEGEAAGTPLLLDDLSSRFRGTLVGPDEQPPSSAMLLPLRPIASEPPAGVLVCGVNPRLVLDDVYRAFLELVAARVSASLAEALVRQKERERIDRMADLDRAKTEFFSNVSHEFRTPLTLLLGPLEELSRREEELPDAIGEEIRVATRNARRLLNQVNTLLDFSKVEAARLHPQFEPIDLAALTRDIASVFRSAAERAGLRLRVECPPLPEPVSVDPQMWEKIVSNLLSNALKFTFEGEIVVELSSRAMHAELIVRDSGVGIPEEDQLHVFKRFHRVQGRRGRTNDGSGIGLALVHELVRLHQGRVRVNSADGQGTTFTVWIPMGRRPLRESTPAAGAANGSATMSVGVATALAEEAESWVPNGDNPSVAGDGERPLRDFAHDLLLPPAVQTLRELAAERARVLVVDDNADMRDYLRRLLKEKWDVTLASDGATALAEIRRVRPDVVIADAMMPGIDGFELLTRIRGEATLESTPVILVTAHAGEEATIEGLRAGADDYIAKPFSTRELLARVQAVIERGRMEAALRDRAAWLRGQGEALEMAVDGVPLEVSLGALVRSATEALGEETRAAFYLGSPDGATLHHIVGMSFQYAEEVDSSLIGAVSLACRSASATGEPVITPDVMTDPRWEPWRWMAERFGYRGCWSFPVHTSAGKFIGAFVVYSPRPRDATARDRQLATLMTQTASIIISRDQESQARRKAEAALLDSTQRLRQLVELMPAAVCACDADGRLTFYNRRAAELWGREPRLDDEQEKFCGSFRMWTPDGDLLAHADCPMAEAMRTGRSASGAEIVIEQPSGARVVASLNIDPIHDREGRVVGAINVFADITESKRAEAALRQAVWRWGADIA